MSIPAPVSHGRRERVLADEDLTRRVIGAFYAVYNTLGFGFLEGVYVRALAIEFARRGLGVEREAPLRVCYLGQCVGAFRADLLVERRIIVEAKAGVRVGEGPAQQLLNYLCGTELEVGLLLYFNERPVVRRVMNFAPAARRVDFKTDNPDLEKR